MVRRKAKKKDEKEEETNYIFRFHFLFYLSFDLSFVPSAFEEIGASVNGAVCSVHRTKDNAFNIKCCMYAGTVENKKKTTKTRKKIASLFPLLLVTFL